VKPDKGYEVKLTDEERLEYFKWRRDRDVLRRPGEEPKPAEKAEKENGAKKEFRDRVMDRAMEYIRAEMAKNGQRGAQAPAAPAPQAPAVPAVRGQQRSQLASSNAVAEVDDRSYRNIVR